MTIISLPFYQFWMIFLQKFCLLFYFIFNLFTPYLDFLELFRVITVIFFSNYLKGSSQFIVSSLICFKGYLVYIIRDLLRTNLTTFMQSEIIETPCKDVHHYYPGTFPAVCNTNSLCTFYIWLCIKSRAIEGTFQSREILTCFILVDKCNAQRYL